MSAGTPSNAPVTFRAGLEPRLHPDWRRLALHSWSFRLSILAALLSGIECAMGVFTAAPPIDPVKFAMLSGLVTTAAALARLLSQQTLLAGSAE